MSERRLIRPPAVDDDGDDEPKPLDARVLEAERASGDWLKGALFCLHLVSGLAQVVLAAVTRRFAFHPIVVRLARNGPIDASGVPGLAIVELSAFHVEFAFAFANLLCAVGFVFSLLFAADEARLIERGVMPFLWTALIFSAVPLLLATELVAGITVWTELFVLALLPLAWLFIYWLGTFINSYAHIDAQRDAGFSWAFLPMAAVFFVGQQLDTYIYAGSKHANGGPGVHLLPLVAATLLYLLIPIALFVMYLRPQQRSARFWMLAVYALNSLCVVVVSWLGFVAFAADGIAVA